MTPRTLHRRVATLRSHRYVQRVAIALGAGTQFGTILFIGTVMAVYVGERGSPFAVSMVLSAYFLGMMVFAPVWGVIADVTGRRRAVLFVTAVGATITLPVLFVVDSVWGQIGIRVVFSIFTVGFLPVILTIVSERGEESTRGRSVGFFTSTRSIGSAASQFGAGVLLGYFFPQQLYLIATGFSAVTILAVLLLEDPTPDPENDLEWADFSEQVRERIVPTGIVSRLDTGLRWMYIALVLRNVTVMGTMSLMPVYILQQVGSSEFTMGVLLGLGPAVQIASMYAVGRLSDSMGRKPLLLVGVAGSGLFPLAASAALLAPALVVREVVVGLGFVTKALAYSALTIGSVTFVGDVADVAEESELMGLRSTAKGIGGIVGPALIGGIATAASMEAAFVAGGLLVLAGAVPLRTRLTETNPSLAPAGD